MAAKQKYTSAQIMHFLIPSLIGAIVFLLPIPMKGSLNTILGIAIDWGKAILKPWLPGTAMVLVVLSALASLWATLCKPEKIAKDSFWGELLIVRPFWLASRLLGAALYIVIFFKLGPEIVWNMDNGGTPAIILAPALLIIFIVLAGVVPLLTDYGLMEYVGTYATAELPRVQLVGKMIGKEYAELEGSAAVKGGEERMGEVLVELRGAGSASIPDVNLEIRRGEVLGLSGLLGSGRSETARLIFGVDRMERGEVDVAGRRRCAAPSRRSAAGSPSAPRTARRRASWGI